MDSITRTAIKEEAVKRGWKFEQFFNDETFYKVTNDKGEWRLGRGSRLGFGDANGMVIARDKLRTYEFIESLGMTPVPYAEIKTHEDAFIFMEKHKPIVIKPRDTEQSKGVSVNVNDEQMARRAVDEAAAYSSKGVVAQAQLVGNLYRVLVVGKQVIAASERRPVSVKGDGHSTIRQLIEIKNRDPRRNNTIDSILKPISIENALKHLGAQKLESVIPSGRIVEVDGVASVSRASESRDVTSQVSPQLAEILVTITQNLGLSICGYDLMAPDLSKIPLVPLPLVEINSMPGLSAHLFPTAGGKAINPAPFILDEAFSSYFKKAITPSSHNT